MGRFNKKEFGNRLREIRESKGYKLETLAKAINKTFSTVARYERGDVIPDVETISNICEELEVSEAELFKSNIIITNTEDSINPFKTNRLYLLYNAYFKKTDTYKYLKIKLNLYDKDGVCMVDFVDYNTDKIYMRGHIVADGNIAVFVLKNHKPNNPRLEVTQIILNISDCMDKIMRGTLTCTNGSYVPSIRKCLVSKNDIEYSEEIRNEIRITEKDKKTLEEQDILYLDIENKDDYEEN